MVLSPCFQHSQMVMILWYMTRMVQILLVCCMAFDNRFLLKLHTCSLPPIMYLHCVGRKGCRQCLLVPLWLYCPKREWGDGLCWHVCSHLWFGMQRTLQAVRFSLMLYLIKHYEVNCSRFEEQHDDYNVIMAKAIADRLAEVYLVSFGVIKNRVTVWLIVKWVGPFLRDLKRVVKWISACPPPAKIERVVLAHELLVSSLVINHSVQKPQCSYYCKNLAPSRSQYLSSSTVKVTKALYFY